MSEEFNQEFAQEQSFSRRGRDSRTQSHKKTKKKSKGKKIFWTLFLILILLGAGGAAYRYLSGDIDGNYRAVTLEEESKNSVKSNEDVSDSETKIDVSQYVDFKVKVKIKNDKAVATETISFDRKEAYNQYKNMLEADIQKHPGISLDDLQQYGTVTTEEDFIKQFNEQTAALAKQSGFTFDEESGTATATIFEGKVNRWTRSIDITKYYDKGGLVASDDKQSTNALDIFKKGESLVFKKTSTGINLEADKDIQLRKD